MVRRLAGVLCHGERFSTSFRARISFRGGREDNCFWPSSLLVRATKGIIEFTVTGPFPSWLPVKRPAEN
jgi:hypothetical protein